MKILCVCGARPNFVKIAPILRAFAARPPLTWHLVHTGQHYDEAMNTWFFDELKIPRPDCNLEVGSGSHAKQTALIMERFEPVLIEQRPAAVLVVGDVNSTMACTLVAVKLGVPVIHVEAGLRSFDRSMPEEINRLVTDAVSDLLLVSEPSGRENLLREGVDPARIRMVGNVMIDSLRTHLDAAAKSTVLERLELPPKRYAAMTLHRPGTVDDACVFGRVCDALEEIQSELPLVFPAHPRTQSMMQRNGIGARLGAMKNVSVIDPLGYLDFLRLLSEAAIVLTDSGGVQEETTVLAVPCLTLRENTERPVTVEQGTNRLVGSDPRRILAGFRDAMKGASRGRVPDLWDGRAAERVAAAILDWGGAAGTSA